MSVIVIPRPRWKEHVPMEVEVEYVVQFTGWLAEIVSVYVGNTQNTIKKRMEQHIQDVDQKLQYNNNSDTFVAHIAQYID